MFTGPNIVQEGLVLALDAANPKSYPGTGTTWNDLVNSSTTLSLYNSPTYSTTNLGRIAFDTTDDYGEFNAKRSDLDFQPTDPFSVFVFHRSLSYDGAAIIANMESGGSYQGWDLWQNTSSTMAMHLISSWSTNAIKVGINYDYSSRNGTDVYLGYTYDGSSPANSTDALNSVNFYINGELETSGKSLVSSPSGDGFNSTSETTSYPISQRFRIGSRWGTGKQQGANPSLYTVQIYNRELTASEVLQNYNATKSRFGL